MIDPRLKIKYDLEDIPKEIPRIKTMPANVSYMMFWTIREYRGENIRCRIHRQILDDLEKHVSFVEELNHMVEKNRFPPLSNFPEWSKLTEKIDCQAMNLIIIERINRLLKENKVKALRIINSFKKFQFDILEIAFELK